ncbi:Flp pilus assembly protein CpaB [Crossiella equi]|uniref:Flp pilus assembly protein CpaB n=1 Tax=Crossiella equi TaxID=130796 RepID=A0ABS5AFB8_9PSEU|nr:SAF domain-containing protein [Crossiella equi]MBP2474894.1 Flp pilus assembly protein CpaB [Crossiella equi]
MHLDRSPWDLLSTQLRRLTGAPLPRRIAAGALAVLAAVLLLQPGTPGPRTTPVLVAARDLPAGSPLTQADVLLRHHPAELAPDGALHELPEPRLLAAPLRKGQPLTDLTVLGPALTHAVAGQDTRTVPVRLADPALSPLLRPGTKIDLVATEPAEVLAEEAVVVTALSGASPDREPPAEGTTILVALPSTNAPRVATSSLTRSVTITLR